MKFHVLTTVRPPWKIIRLQPIVDAFPLRFVLSAQRSLSFRGRGGSLSVQHHYRYRPERGRVLWTSLDTEREKARGTSIVPTAGNEINTLNFSAAIHAIGVDFPRAVATSSRDTRGAKTPQEHDDRSFISISSHRNRASPRPLRRREVLMQTSFRWVSKLPSFKFPFCKRNTVATETWNLSVAGFINRTRDACNTNNH